MSNPFLGPVDETPAVRSPVTDDALRAVRVMIDAYRVMEELLPRTIPTLCGFDIAGVNEASFEVGGDYYEFIPLPDDRWGIIIADVVGKGIGAALLVSAIRASLYALVGRELAARALMRRANRFFYDSVRTAGMSPSSTPSSMCRRAG